MVSEVEAFWGTCEGKNYKKKGYFESADELLSLRNNLSLSKIVERSVQNISRKTRSRRVFVVYTEKSRTLNRTQENYIFC